MDSSKPIGRLDPSAAIDLSWQRACFVIGIVLLANIVAYFDSFEGVFVYDGRYAIRDNLNIRTLWPLSEAMSLPLINEGLTVSRRPLLSLSFALNYWLFGAEPWGFHLVNLAIHMTAALLLFDLVRRTLCLDPFRSRYGGKSVGLALAVALIWSLHPLQTESVTYIVQRAESLSGMLYLLTMWCALRGFHSPHARSWYAGAVLACGIGMGVKEVIVTAPIVLFLYDGTFVSACFRSAWRQRWKFYTALAATWSLCGLLQLAGWQDVQTDFTDRSPLTYALTQPGVILYYLRLSVWPDPLIMDYNWPHAESLGAIVPAGCVIVLLLGVSGWGLYRRRWFGFVGAWFFLILGPSSSFVALVQNLEEHRMYLSLAALVVLGTLAADWFLDRTIGGFPNRHRPLIGTVLVLAVAVIFTSRTMRRNLDYHSAIALWSGNIVSLTGSESSVAHHHMANALFVHGQMAEAIHQYRHAIRIAPDNSLAHFNLGNALYDQGQLTAAIRHFQQAIKIEPNHAMAYNNLGNVMFNQGQMAEAIGYYRRTVTIVPDNSNAHYNLANALSAQGQSAEAVGQFRLAIKLAPEFAKAHYNLALAYEKLGRTNLAMAHFEQASRLGFGR
jgi:Flp pilus assembly protein TadD